MVVCRKFLADAELENTPSRRDGVPAEVEDEQHRWACVYMQEGGVMLGIPQMAVCTAQVLFGRFYLKQSMTRCGLP